MKMSQKRPFAKSVTLVILLMQSVAPFRKVPVGEVSL